jgi:WD40 repeat protein
MSVTKTPFFVTGGTLQQDAPSYVERQADRDLYEGLTRGEFCYVLTSRQMGKSSLMIHTAARLRQEGIAVVVLDLTAIGQNLSPEQWYGGLLRRLGRQLELEDELDDFWLEQERLGPLQRWMTALGEVVLPKVPGRIVIFVDEIDAVRSLPFSTDEFFAGIRECYNRRTQDLEYARLTFCLLGVASPADLISDQRTSPFNIGRRIQLVDFTPQEAAPLALGLVRGTPPPALPLEGEGSLAPPSLRGKGAGGLGPAQRLLERVLYWTGGQPYLTQRLCRAVAEDRQATSPADVDRLCDALFLTRTAREVDDNLAFVRSRLLRSEPDLASLLDLYRKVQRGRGARAISERVMSGRSPGVRDDETNPLATILKLSGVVRVVDGLLQVRNRIYDRVFDQEWVVTHTPGAELRRQRAAYRRGLWRAAAVSGAILAVMAGLALAAVTQAHRANRIARQEAHQRRLAQEGQRLLRHYLYAAQMSLAQQSEERGNVGLARQMLEAQRPGPGQEDLRGFEWRYLWRRCQDSARSTLRGHSDVITAVAFSPDGRTMASASLDRSVRLWNAASRREIGSLNGHTSAVWFIAFSPDGKMLVTSSQDKTIKLWDIASRRAVATLKGHRGAVGPLALSPDGKILASGSQDRTVKLWDVASRRQIGSLNGYTGWFQLALSPDGRTLAMGQRDGLVKLWDVPTRRQVATLRGHRDFVQSVAFSPDSRLLASGSTDTTIRLWARGRGRWGAQGPAGTREVAVLKGHANVVGSLAFAPDGKTLASGSDDHTVRLWNVAARQELATLKGHTDQVWYVAFSPDGRSLASGSADSTVKLWAVSARNSIAPLGVDRPAPGALKRASTSVIQGNSSAIALAFAPDGSSLATAHRDGTVKLWDVASLHEVETLRGHKALVGSLAFRPDGKMVASGSDDGTVKLWNLASRRVVATLKGFRGGLWSVAFSPNGQMLAMRGKDAVKLWDLSTNRFVNSFKCQPGVWALTFSPDSNILAAVSRPGSVTLWDIAARRAVGTVSGVGPIQFSPDRRILATGGSRGTVKLWDVATKRLIASLRGHATGGGFAFSPDGKNMATRGTSTITLWDLTVHQEVATLKGHTGWVNDVAFSPDGNTLASAGDDGTVRLWHAATFQEADPLRVVAGGSDRTVRLQWRPVTSALAYNVYRRSVESPELRLESSNDPSSHPQLSTGFVKLNAQPVKDASFTDQSSNLVNGRPQTYGVAAVFKGADGKAVEGPPVTLQAIPVQSPPGLIGYSINEGIHSGSVVFDGATRVITVRGSGADIWDTADEFYFLSQPTEGNIQITVRALTRPTATHVWAKAGLMIRESLDPGARDAYLVTTPANGLSFQWRSTANEDCETQEVISHAALKMPITLRLTRQGDIITAEYSKDGGKSFQQGGDPLSFAPPLPKTLYVGLAITSHAGSKISEAKFQDLQITLKK